MPEKDPLLVDEMILRKGGLGIALSDGTQIIDGTNGAVGPVGIADASVTKAKLSDSLKPSDVTKFCDYYTTVGGAATEVIAVGGVLNSDFPFVQLVDPGTNVVSVINVSVDPDAINVTFSADPGNDAVIVYQILRVTP